MTTINYNIFGQINIKLKSTNVTLDNLQYVDIGDIHLRLDDREYKLDYIHMGRGLEDGIINISADLGSFEEAQDCFDDCLFNLRLEDLTHPDLYTTIYIGSDEDSIKLEFISGSIEVDLGTNQQEYIIINSND